jgi:heavy metal efflux system protein
MDPPYQQPMISRVINFALHQRFVMVALTLLLVTMGIVSFFRLPIEAYPDVGDVKVEVITLWPGHAAEEVERLVTIPIENELNGIANVTFLRSDTLFGLSNIKILFADGTDRYWARAQAQERIAQASLPADVKPALGPLSSVIGEVYRYTLESKTWPLVEIKAIQDWMLEREFKKVPGVADVVSWGGGTKQYQIDVDPGRLRAYNLTLKQIFDAVSNNNSNAGSGFVERGEYRVPVRGVGLIQSLADIENIVVAAQKGTPVRVRDIGTVGIGHAIRLGVLGRDHDDDLVQGIVLMRTGENPGKVIEAVKAKVQEVQKLLPDGVELRPYYSRDWLVNTTVRTVLRNLIEGAVLVIVMLSIFLYNVRAAVIVALTIPLSLLFAFIFMDLRGIPANLLSLGAIDFGIIIDGAVVMTENIVRHLGHEKPTGPRVLREVQRAGSEVARPLTFAVLIIMTVYLPILTFQRIEGKLFTPMAVTISVAVVGALILTLTLIPVLASLFFRRPPSERESPVLRALRAIYGPAIRWCLRRPIFPVLGAAGLLAVALFVFTLLGKEFLPELDEGDIWVRVQFPIGISMQAVRRPTREIRERLLAFPEVRVVVSQLGAPDDGTDAEGLDNLEFYVGLKPRAEWATKNRDKAKLVAAMTESLATIPGITTNFSQPIKDNVDEALAGVKGELAIKLHGPDIFVMDGLAKQIVAVLKDILGVADLDYDHLIGQPQLQIVVDRAAAARYGINVQDVQDVIEAATKGRVVTEVFENERRFGLAVRLKPQEADSVASLRNVTVSAPSGERIPLTQLAEFSLTDGISEILREGNVRRLAVKWSVRDRDMGGLVSEAMPKVAAALRLPEGYSIIWSGRFEDQQRALARLYVIVPMVLFIIFVLLFSAFQSIADALMIMLNLPFAIIGGTLALFFWGTHFSISAAVGYIAVFGVSVLDGVVLVSFIRQAASEGLPIREAIKRGCEVRFRPIIVTAIVAIIGFLPAALSHDIGAEIQQPLARVVIGGLVSATAMTLLVLPAVYELIARWQERQAQRRRPAPPATL